MFWYARPCRSRPTLFDALVKGWRPRTEGADDDAVHAAAQGGSADRSAGQRHATGARVVYAKGERRVIDGPFTEAKELIAGFYLIQVKSKEEAIEWARRCPVDYAVQGDQEAVVEVRQVADMADLPTATDEQRATDQRLRDQLSGW